MKARIKVSIIIVHYKRFDLLKACISSIYKSKPKISFEIIVVDNDEHPNIKNKLLKKFSKVIYIPSNGNVGYGAGNNLGAKNAKGEYLFILNPDTKILDDAIDTLTNFLDNHISVAIAAPVLFDKYKKPFKQVGFHELTPFRALFVLSFLNKLFPMNPITKKYFSVVRKQNGYSIADTVAGSAFFIRSEVFKSVGRFDERFFMYFEENDLGIRVRKNGNEIATVNKAKVKHIWEGSTKNVLLKNKYFKQSRRYYFRKHYGITSMFLTEIFALTSKWTILLMGILLLGTALRFSNFLDHMTFHGELGDNYTNARELYESKTIPLIGPPTSHSWLSFGPIFYWIIIPILAIFRFNPVSVFVFMLAVHTLLIVISFFTISSVKDKLTGITVASLIAVSPIYIEFARESRFFSLVLILFFPFIWALIRKRLFLAGIFYGLILNFHLTPLVYIPVIIVFLFRIRQNISTQSLRNGFFGLALFHFPHLLFLLLNNPSTIFKAIAWIPYRIYSTSSQLQTAISGVSITNFLSSLVIFQSSTIVALSILIIILIYIYRNVSSFELIISAFFVVGMLGIFIHGNAPSHYYLPLIPPLSIIVATFISKRAVYALLAILLIFFSNLNYYFGPDLRFERGLIPYVSQVTVMKDILSQVDGKKFVLQRTGYSDQFDYDYAQNYIYLAWLFGNRPVENAQLIVHLYEKDGKVTYTINEKK